MRAAGVSSRKVIAPVLLFASMGAVAGGLCVPAAHAVCDPAEHGASSMNSARPALGRIQPRIFDENFPNTILYVGDVRPGGDRGLGRLFSSPT